MLARKYVKFIAMMSSGLIFSACDGTEEEDVWRVGEDDCVLASQSDGTIGISCPGGESGTLFYAPDGEDGVFCSIGENDDGQEVIVCKDGTQAVIEHGEQGPQGPDGQAGEDGLLTLVRLEPMGNIDTCEGGGYAVHAGLDVNTDGLLAEDEITSTQYICHGVDGPEGQPGQDAEPGMDALIRLDSEPAGDNCSEGGIAVFAGVDSDADGELSNEEITTTTYVCHGEQGPDGEPGEAGKDSLTQMAVEPAGANCEFGGVTVFTGLDADDDGELSEEEIEETTYLCHGSPGDPGVPGDPGPGGDPGADGKDSLIRLEPELSGPNCPAGGYAVLVGIDENGDETLDDIEVDESKTSYICHEFSEPKGVIDEEAFTPDGHQFTQTSDALESEAYTGVVQVDGKIVIAGYALESSYQAFSLVRYHSDGTLDDSFGVDGVVTLPVGDGDAIIRKIALQSDGKIIAAGKSDNPDVGLTNDVLTMIRLNDDGSLDTNFGTAGFVTIEGSPGEDHELTSLAIDRNDDTIVFVGNIGSEAVIGKVNSSGDLMSSFGGGTTILSDYDVVNLYDVAITPDDHIAVVGHVNSGGQDYGFVARIQSDGQVDSDYGTAGYALLTNGMDSNIIFRSVVVQSDNRVIAAGQGILGVDTVSTIVRLTIDGNADGSFGGTGYVIDNALQLEAIIMQSNTKIVAIGRDSSGSGTVIMRYNNNGLLDMGFGNDGTGIVSMPLIEAELVAMQPDNKMVISGTNFYLADDDGTPVPARRMAVARYR